ncbi:unnamed protein product [Vitrella brassicaformis CCMP3155]|uniref:Uncharacterized protein n=2 Tax=Vitrella brassicaformis TaxID=1169539 RepID=A0A0G4EX84_VITBC|nr:unnamed protein product [Vitrella brassicaformis CCMP3155]|eukprot:CEM02705.1 unnamed protein product [Vitrella brassicaformis CCMP3155]
MSGGHNNPPWRPDCPSGQSRRPGENASDAFVPAPSHYGYFNPSASAHGVYVYAPPVAVQRGSPAASQAQGTAQAQPPAGPPIGPVPQQSASASASVGGAPQPISTEDSHEEPEGTTGGGKRKRDTDDDQEEEEAQAEGDDLHGVDGNAGGPDGHGGDEIDQVSGGPLSEQMGDGGRGGRMTKHKAQNQRRRRRKTVPAGDRMVMPKPSTAAPEPFPVSQEPREIDQPLPMWGEDGQPTTVNIHREEAPVFGEEDFAAVRTYNLIKSILGGDISLFVYTLADDPGVLCPYLPRGEGTTPPVFSSLITFTVATHLTKRIGGNRTTRTSLAEYAAITMTTKQPDGTLRHFTFEIGFHFEKGGRHHREVLQRYLTLNAFHQLGQLLSAHNYTWFTRKEVSGLATLEKPHLVLYLYYNDGRVPTDLPAPSPGEKGALQPGQNYSSSLATTRGISPVNIRCHVDLLAKFIDAYMGAGKTLWSGCKVPNDAEMLRRRKAKGVKTQTH